MIFWWRIKRNLRRWALPTFLVLVVFLAGFSLIYFGKDLITGWVTKTPSSAKTATPFLGTPFALDDYIAVDVAIFDQGILLKADCKGIWIAMPYEKTFSIKRAQEGTFDIRPTQHDLMYDLMTNYNITMDYARIENMEYDIFYATVLLETDTKILQLDTRPSDALVLAERMHTPVYVSSTLMRKEGKNICPQ